MIDGALSFLQQEANAYLSSGRSDEVVKLEVPKKHEGAGAPGQILISLIKVEQERVLMAQTRIERDEDGHVAYLREPELKLNLHVLIAADYSQHFEALRALSSIVTFFQARRRFNPTTNSSLDPRIEQLTVELEDIDYEQQNQIWGALGTNYLPSVIYRIRLVTIQAAEREVDGAPISIVDLQNG